MRLPLPARLALPAAAIAAGASTLAPAPATTPVKPWDKDEDCSWWLSADDGNSLRASIGIGDDTLVLSLADKVFLAWPEEDRPRVELWFNGDARRRFETKGWSSHVGTETAIFGLYLDAKARRLWPARQAWRCAATASGSSNWRLRRLRGGPNSRPAYRPRGMGLPIRNSGLHGGGGRNSQVQSAFKP